MSFKYTDLPNWGSLTKEEKDSLKKVLRVKSYEDLIDESSISEKELAKSAKRALAYKVSSEKPLKSNVPLDIQNVPFVDYRDPIWGDSYNWAWNRKLSEPTYMVIHHTVTSEEATPNDIALLHKARGWGGIGYHFLINKEGIIYYVGDIGTARANVLDMNEKVIGIAFIADLTKTNPTEKMIRSAHYLCEHLMYNIPELKNITSWSSLVGHKDLQATACPGTEWHEKTRSLIIQGKVAEDYEALYKDIVSKFNALKLSTNEKVESYEWAKDFLGVSNRTRFKEVVELHVSRSNDYGVLFEALEGLMDEDFNPDRDRDRIVVRLTSMLKECKDSAKELARIKSAPVMPLPTWVYDFAAYLKSKIKSKS